LRLEKVFLKERKKRKIFEVRESRLPERVVGNKEVQPMKALRDVAERGEE